MQSRWVDRDAKAAVDRIAAAGISPEIALRVDPTRANAVLSLIDQPEGAKLCEEVYSGRVGLVPYVRPGFGLAKAAATTFDKNPKVEGLILDKHGIFSFGASAKESYERMIEL